MDMDEKVLQMTDEEFQKWANEEPEVELSDEQVAGVRRKCEVEGLAGQALEDAVVTETATLKAQLGVIALLQRRADARVYDLQRAVDAGRPVEKATDGKATDGRTDDDAASDAAPEGDGLR